MKFLLTSIGTRGDIEPFLAQAEILRDRGEEVICLFPEQFRETTERMGLRFYGYSREFLEILDSPDAQMIMGGMGSFTHRTRVLYRIFRHTMHLQRDMMRLQHELIQREHPDRIVYHPKALYPLVWGLDHPGQSIMVSPIPCVSHPVNHLSVMGTKGNANLGRTLNRLSYWLVNTVRARLTYRLVRPYLDDFKHSGIGTSRLRKQMAEHERTHYAVSPALFSEPGYWPASAKVVGFYDRNKTIDWQPSTSLLDFLQQNDNVLFITFGSISNDKPREKTEAILSVLRKHEIPAIINTSWGGLLALDSAPDHVLFVDNIPYDWIFSRVYAVVHHGGSGTTHSATRAGCPSLIIPHVVDQFFWNRRIAELGLGLRGKPIKMLRADNFEENLMQLWTGKQYKEKAMQVAGQMAAESDPEWLYQQLTAASQVTAAR